MSEDTLTRVLFVDDEPNVLDGIRRQLRGKYKVFTATSGAEGLELLSREAMIPIVVSDMRMPLMNGAEFLAQVRRRWSDSVRLVLSGQSEINAAIDAVNEGHILRFLTKPCAPEVLTGTLEAAYQQYRLVVAERELLEKTLNGAVTLLTEIMAMVDKEAFSKATRLKRYVEELSGALELSNAWELKLAAMLSQIGCLSVPREILDKVMAGQELSGNERELYEEHPRIAAGLLERIPRLERVARMIADHGQAPAADVLSKDLTAWDVQILGAQVVRVASEFDTLLTQGASRHQAVKNLADGSGKFHPALLDALLKIDVTDVGENVRSVRVVNLRTGMIIDEDLKTTGGTLLVAHGSQVTDTMLSVLRNYARDGRVQEPFRVRVPRAPAQRVA
jgi:response regulator RpfG family c-di-GMP phosphodiesterase